MTTKGLLGYIIRGVRRGSINLYDSGFSCLGPRIVKFLMTLKSEEKIRFKSNLEKIIWVDEDHPVPAELQRRYAYLVEIDEMEADMRKRELKRVLKTGKPVSEPTWTLIFRPIQGDKILHLILDGKIEHLMDQTYFVDCECQYAYWIDMDREVLEIEMGDYEVKIPFKGLEEGIYREIYSLGVPMITMRIGRISCASCWVK